VNDARARTLITIDELVRLMDAGPAVVLLDVIDEQGAAPEDRPKIPGALSVHLATDFSGTPTPVSGRRPLPDVSDLQAKARAWGISSATPIVVYDNAGGAQASRAWWTLRWAGLTNVRILDGGYGAWTAAGRGSSKQVATRASHAGDVELTAGHMPTIDADEAATLAQQSRLFDARPRSSYVGDPAKAGTGHIPGAIHAPAGGNITDGKFKASASSAPMAPARSESIAAVATRLRTRSLPWRRLDSRPRSTWDRGRPGAPIRHARSRPERSQSKRECD
jgi:thiosulfate/3-mercaptopyruvate sulfurtransferase